MPRMAQIPIPPDSSAPPPEVPEAPEEARMHFGDHLEDLRYRVILALAGVAVVCAGTLVFGRRIVAWLCQPLLEAQLAAHVTAQAYTLSPVSGFAVYLKVSMIAAVILAMPWVLYQFWWFFAAGLYPKERKAVLLLAPFSAVMTLMGTLFMYYVMLPVCLWFLISFSTSFPIIHESQPPLIFSALNQAVSENTPPPQDLANSMSPTLIPVLKRSPAQPTEGQVWIDRSLRQIRIYLDGQTQVVPFQSPSLISPLIEIGQYINFVLVLAVGIVVSFQLPVAMLIVGWWGLVDPVLVARYRKYCVFVCFASGMVLTPSDVLSMLLLAFPLWGLFEFGLVLMRMVYRHRDDAAAAG